MVTRRWAIVAFRGAVGGLVAWRKPASSGHVERCAENLVQRPQAHLVSGAHLLGCADLMYSGAALLCFHDRPDDRLDGCVQALNHRVVLVQSRPVDLDHHLRAGRLTRIPLRSLQRWQTTSPNRCLAPGRASYPTRVLSWDARPDRISSPPRRVARWRREGNRVR